VLPWTPLKGEAQVGAPASFPPGGGFLRAFVLSRGPGCRASWWEQRSRMQSLLVGPWVKPRPFFPLATDVKSAYHPNMNRPSGLSD
jgi:hypothetical protein